MTSSPTHITLATSSGPMWLILATHFGAGLAAIVAGVVAIVASKGSLLHKQSGVIFTIGMIAVGVLASVIAASEGKDTQIVGGLFAAYLVFTGFTTVRPLPLTPRAQLGVTCIGILIALADASFAITALRSPNGLVGSVPAPMILFLSTIALFAAAGDIRLLRAGGIQGTRRLARHLWRMCFAFFIASGSFFLGQMKFLPPALRVVPLLGVLAVAPLVVLLYWMWRIRIRHQLRGMTLARLGK